MDTLIITGASGFIGKRFINLYRDSYRIIPIIRRSADLTSLQDLHCIYSDELEKVALIGASLFLNLSGKNTTEVETGAQSNIQFPSKVLDYFLASGGSYVVNAGSHLQLLKDSESTYVKQKNRFEDILRAAKVKHLTFLIFDTYGPGIDQLKILSLVRDAALNQKEVELTGGEQLYDAVHVDDVCDCLATALNEIPRTEGRFMLNGGHGKKLRQVIETYLEVNKLTAKLRWGNRPYRSTDYFDLSTDLLMFPGWSPKIQLAEGLIGI